MYSLRNSENFPQPIQMQLSKTQKTFAQFLCCIGAFFDKKDDLHSSCISEITYWGRRG